MLPGYGQAAQHACALTAGASQETEQILMALKLQVPWSEEPLEVPQLPESVIDAIRGANGPHVETPDDDVHVVDFFGENNKVPDVSRYRILEDGHCGCVRHNNRYRIHDGRHIVPHCDVSEPELAQRLQQEVRNVVLLLESPHKDEYQAGNVDCPIAPASGMAGNNIDRCLGKVLAGVEGLIMPCSHVIISNPIQFQTSLHAIHGKPLSGDWKTLRNKVWEKLWCERYIQQDFQTRLAAYNPSVIINACTHDEGCKDEKCLKDLLGQTSSEPNGPECKKRTIYNFLAQNFQDARIYTAAHPSSRYWERNGLKLLQQRRQNRPGPSTGTNGGQE